MCIRDRLFIAWSQARYTLNTETDVIIAMAGHIANAIQNATLYEEAKGRRELGVLLEASKVFTSTLDMQGILNSFARIGAEAAKADVAVVYTLSLIHIWLSHLGDEISRVGKHPAVFVTRWPRPKQSRQSRIIHLQMCIRDRSLSSVCWIIVFSLSSSPCLGCWNV